MATTAEIARLANLSRTTVSAVLNGKPNVREETRQKVLACVREHGLEQGVLSKSLVTEMSNVVAIMAPNMSNPFYGSLYDAMEARLAEGGFNVLFYRVRHEDEEDPATLRLIKAYHPRGYIVPSGSEGKAAASLRTLTESQIPVVVIDYVSGLKTNCVVFDNRAACRCIVEYVLSMGHKRLAYLAGPKRSGGAKQRQLGFWESVVEAELPMADFRVIETGESAEEGYRAALELLSETAWQPTAVLAYNDMVAVGVYRAAHELGLRIPEDLSVTGFDNIELAEALGPPLTTVSIHPQTLGEAAADLLMEIIKTGLSDRPLEREVQFHLIKRDSVKRMSSS